MRIRSNRHPLLKAIFCLHNAYEVRDGKDYEDGVTVTIEDPQGLRWSVQLSRHAADDLALHIEDLVTRRRDDNKTSGALLQACGEGNTGQIIISLDRGIADTDPDNLHRRQRMVHHQFTKAASLAEQPDGIEELLAGGPGEST